MTTFADVILFKANGKLYTEEPWRIPEDAIGPYDMKRSPDFRRIGGGAVLVVSQEPWGYPHLFPGESTRESLALAWDEGHREGVVTEQWRSAATPASNPHRGA